jgi:hypothetical protein
VIKRCWALRSLSVEASPVAGALAVKVSCFCAEFSLEQAERARAVATVHAKRRDRVNNIDDPFIKILNRKGLRIAKKQTAMWFIAHQL